MEKPFSLKVQELEQKIIDDINSSQMPAYVLKTILKDIYMQIETSESEEIKEYYDSKKEKESDN